MPSSTPAADSAPEWAPASGVTPPGQSGDTGQDHAATTPAAGNRNNGDAAGKAKGHDKP
jgi:hypothetical protein